MSKATDLARECGMEIYTGTAQLEEFFRRAQAMALKDAATRLRRVESDLLNDLADELEKPK